MLELHGLYFQSGNYKTLWLGVLGAEVPIQLEDKKSWENGWRHLT